MAASLIKYHTETYKVPELRKFRPSNFTPAAFEKQILLVVARFAHYREWSNNVFESEDVPGCDEDPALTDRQMDNLGLYSALRCRLQDDKDDFEYLVKWTGATLPFVLEARQHVE